MSLGQVGVVDRVVDKCSRGGDPAPLAGSVVKQFILPGDGWLKPPAITQPSTYFE